MTDRIKESIPVKYYQKSVKVQSRYFNMMKEWVAKQPVKSLMYRMNKVVKKHLEAYEEDFFIHDVQTILYSGKNRQMLWVVRKNGTHMVDLNSLLFSSKSDWSSRSYFDALVGMSGRRHYYFINDSDMNEIDEEKCFEYLNQFEKINREKVEKGQKEQDRLLANKEYSQKFDYRGREIKKPTKKNVAKKSTSKIQKQTTAQKTSETAINEISNNKKVEENVIRMKTIDTTSKDGVVKDGVFEYTVDEEGQLNWFVG